MNKKRLEYETFVLPQENKVGRIQIYSKPGNGLKRNNKLWYIKIPSRAHGVATS